MIFFYICNRYHLWHTVFYSGCVLCRMDTLLCTRLHSKATHTSLTSCCSTEPHPMSLQWWVDRDSAANAAFMCEQHWGERKGTFSGVFPVEVHWKGTRTKWYIFTKAVLHNKHFMVASIHNLSNPYLYKRYSHSYMMLIILFCPFPGSVITLWAILNDLDCLKRIRHP